MVPQLHSNNPFCTWAAPGGTNDEAPPTYEEATATGQALQPEDSSPRSAPPFGAVVVPQPVPQPDASLERNPFPRSFGIYPSILRKTIALCDDLGETTHVVQLEPRPVGGPKLVLHSGPTVSFPRLAALTPSPAKMTIKVAPLPQATDVEVYGSWKYRFDFGNDTFEWRPSQSAAVKALGASPLGMKLVRLGARARPGEAVSSDGFEIVAVWADPTWSKSKTATYAFLGSGADGVLGPRWAITAVMCALGIARKLRRL